MGVLALFAIGGFVAGPLVLRHVAEQRLGQWLGREVTIERLEVNPLALSVTAERLTVREAGGNRPFLSIRRLYANAELASVLRRALIVSELRVDSPRLRVERRGAARAAGEAPAYNFSDLLARLAAPSKVAQAGGRALPRFSINNIRIVDGALTFDDLPLHRRHEISEVALGIPFVSTLPAAIDTFVEPGMSGLVDGTPFAIRGHTKPFKDTLQTVVELRLNALDLTRYLPYLPLPIDATVASAQLTAALDISFALPRDEAPLLSLRGTAALGNVSLRERGAAARRLLELRYLAVTVADLDLLARRFFVDRVSASGIEVFLRRTATGKLNLAALLPRTAPSGARFALRELRIDQSSLRFRDEATRPPFEARVDDISLSVDHLSNAPGAEATLAAAFTASPGGRVSQSGRFTLAPLGSSGTISIDGVEPRRFAPYYRDEVAFEIVGGRLRADASYQFVDGPDHLSLHLRDGSGEMRELRLRRPGTPSASLRLRRLTVRGVDFDLTALVPPSAARRWAIGAARLALEGGEVRVVDRSIRPTTSMKLTGLAARVTGLSSRPGTLAALDLHGRVPPKGVLAIAGTFNPFGEDLALDLKGEAKDIDLLPASPYAVKYLGHGIETGTLSLSVDCHVAKRRLDAHNRIVIARLTLGEKVPGPDAVNLPVKLAVALLEDRRGVINVDVPLSGALDDPHFELSGLIWQALGREVVRATSDPFPLIARAFGGDGLSYVAFPAGLARLDGAERDKLVSLAEALKARPELSFQISGGADPQRDLEGLRRDPTLANVRIGEEEVRALALRRAKAVEESLARLAPYSTGRIFLAAPRVASGATRVELTLVTDRAAP